MTGVMPTEAAAAFEVLRRALGGEAGGGPTLPELWDHYKRAEKSKLRSWRDVEYRGRCLLAFFGDRPALTLTPLDVDAYRDHRRATLTRRRKPPTAATRNRDVAVLRHLLNFAVDNRLLPLNPLSRVKLEPERNIRQTVVAEPELQRILKACPPMLRAIVAVLADSGCRRMEILRLRWDQVDLERGIVTLGAENTKSGRPRKVPLTQRAAAAIKGVRRRPPSPYVFTPKSGKPHNPRHLYRLYQRAVVAAGLQGVNGEPITFHTLRHSFVSQARRRGIPERTVMAITGHATRSAFDRYGSRVDEEEIAGAVAKMEAGRQPARAVRKKRPTDKTPVGQREEETP